MKEIYPQFIYNLISFLQKSQFKSHNLNYEKYVELGINTPCFVHDGENNSRFYRNNFKLVAPLFKVAHAVDINPYCLNYIRDIKGLVWHHMTTAHFIRNEMPHIGKVDVVFIDACHTFKASYNDFIGMAPYVRENGIVLLHDSHPHDPKYINTDGNGSGEVYKTAEKDKK